MKRLYSWLLRRFLLAFAVLIAVQLLINAAGIGLLLSGYAKAEMNRLENLALELLVNPARYEDEQIAYAGPFFVYSADRRLIYSNRGKGRSIDTDQLLPVRYDGAVIGYFYAAEIQFYDNRANRVLLISFIILAGVSIVFSFLIGLISAWYSSKKIAVPVGTIRNDIHQILSLKDIPQRSFGITELTDMSADISEVSTEIRRQDDYKKQWMRDLAHDLRTPVGGLKSQLEAMLDGVLEPDPDRLSRNLSEVIRIEKLVSAMGELAAVEDADEIESGTVVSADFAADLLTPFEMLIRQKGIEVEKEIALESFAADRQLLLRGIGNIMSNAVSYTEEGGRIWIRIYSPEAEAGGFAACIEIANNGPDIIGEARGRVFDRLYRGDTARATPGSGLGLSITRKIIELHNGEIILKSLEPRGVRFISFLP